MLTWGEKVLRDSENWLQTEVHGDEEHTLVEATTTPHPPTEGPCIGKG